MPTTPMSDAEIAALNARYHKEQAADPSEGAHVLNHRVAVAHHLDELRYDPQRGWLYRSRAGRHVYGLERGGFGKPDEDDEMAAHAR